MAILSSSFILLSIIYQNVLYINQPYNVQEAFICFNNEDGSTNDSWPEAWFRMMPTRINNNKLPVFRSPNLKNSSVYKLKFIFQDRSVGDFEDWKPLVRDQDNRCSNQTVDVKCAADPVMYEEPNLKTISTLIYFILVTSLILLLKSYAKWLWLIRRRKGEEDENVVQVP